MYMYSWCDWVIRGLCGINRFSVGKHMKMSVHFVINYKTGNFIFSTAFKIIIVISTKV